ncbi:hypothetical protein [Synoicihabitans lomoniglobus]|uniref:Uncharacterized protein n=1 Tax=Synoicihabitans lomoniglobus TaxID=2909285 RepID=A0AAE9ZZ78_9BACT|nr:hypothetical protein [Opitutaceae bacterium LMO-M01]WED65468.1 hypothetical protein PXH66_01220 [Opitutaceae bacterium LMO-M01]
MMPEKKAPQKVTLDDLFAIKRAERPSQDYWNEFQQEFHIRQRAAAVEPKRWWFVLPRVFAGFSRYQMPMGAAAVLAVTFLSFSEYREPGFEVAYTTTSSVAKSLSPVEEPADVVAAAVTVEETAENAVSTADVPAVVKPSLAAAQTPARSDPVTISPMVVWAGVAAGESAKNAAVPSPSQRSIAANLAAIEAEQPQMINLLNQPRLGLTASAPRTDPLSEVSGPNASRDRLFAYQANASEFASNDEDASGRDVETLIARRLSDDLLYDSIRRVTAGGDRLTLKF